MLCWPARTAATDGLAFSRRLQLGRKRHPLFPVLFRLQPRFPRRRVPQLALQALGFGTGLGVLQRDQCLSGVDDVTVRDQNFPDDAALEVLNCLAARFRIRRCRQQSRHSRAGQRSTRYRGRGQSSRPAGFPVQVTPRSRSRSAGGADPEPRNLPDLERGEGNFQTITIPSGRASVRTFAADHGKTGRRRRAGAAVAATRLPAA